MKEVREFEFNDRDFRFIQRLARERAGIVLAESKRDLVYSRLSRRLRELKLTRFRDYCRYLETHEAEEMEHFLNALTTNLTAFFREAHHFDYLRQELLPRLLQQRPDKCLKIWSAGCSTGEEPYSIAMTVADHVPADWRVRILATDLDSRVLAQAQTGIYPLETLKGVPEALRRRYFLRGRGARTGLVRVKPELMAMIVFRRLNLMGPWPMKGKFDVIFCRNVFIYFDKPTQARLAERFAEILAPDGHLFLGHSETLHRISDRFTLLGHTIYRKAA